MDDFYWVTAFPTDIENWPPELLARSIDTAIIKLTAEQATALRTTNSYGLEMRMEKPPENAPAILEELEPIISGVISDRFPKGAFVRLGSRSPKDSWEGAIKGFRCENGQKALELLADSERVYDDLLLANNHDCLPALVLRKWIEIENWQEFRAFVKNGKLVGISQYDYFDFYSEIPARAREIEAAIREECEAVIPLLPAANMIADFIVLEEDGCLKAMLLEINPFFVFTDPCLFDWRKDTFETFEFRYLTDPPEQPDINRLLKDKS